MLLNYYENCSMNGVEHIHVLLKRNMNIPYNNIGRFSDFETSINIDNYIKEFLDEIGIKYIEIDSEEESIIELYKELIN
jgi:hypothetical protein